MAKKKSKSKKSKNTNTQSDQHSQNDQNGVSLTSNGVGQASTVALGALVGEIMLIAIERVIDKLSKNHQGDNAQDENTLLTLAISGLQDSLQAFQKPAQQAVADVKETAKSVAVDAPANLADRAVAVKENLSNAIVEPVSTAKTTANVAVGEIFDTAKTVVGAISALSSDKQKKKKPKK